MTDIKAIKKIQEKLISKQNQPSTEEATKQWLVIPLLVALGYDPYSSDIVPEYTLDVGVKKGEKVDYALQINNQTVAIIECKQLKENLSDKYINQLYRYFTVSDVHIAILTNGDEYQFFTDSQKENIMDLEPYFKIQLSSASDTELNKLDMYSKEKIQYNDMSKMVKYEKFQSECKELISGLKQNNIPSWLIDILIERSGGLTDFSKSVLADYIYNEVKKEFKIRGPKSSKVEEPKQDLKETLRKSKENISQIKLNHEYVYNDYSDGDWKFHQIEYAIILGVRYDNITAKQLLIYTVKELLEQHKISEHTLITSDKFSGTYKLGIGKGENIRSPYYFEEHDLYVGTSYGVNDIVKFIEILLSLAGLRDSQVIVSFKS